MNRVDILQTAESLINGDREKDYGSARDNFTRIGNLWAEIFGHPVTPEQVALCMNQVKVARLVVTPDHRDSWIDGAGYFALGGEIATEPETGPESKRKPRQWQRLSDVDLLDGVYEVVDSIGRHWRNYWECYTGRYYWATFDGPEPHDTRKAKTDLSGWGPFTEILT